MNLIVAPIHASQFERYIMLVTVKWQHVVWARVVSQILYMLLQPSEHLMFLRGDRARSGCRPVRILLASQMVEAGFSTRTVESFHEERSLYPAYA